MENGSALATSRNRDARPVVVLDNRVADGKAHSHAVVLGRKHGLEDLINIGGVNPPSRYPRWILAHDRDQSIPVLIESTRSFCGAHRIDGIRNQIQNHLLQLNFGCPTQVECDGRISVQDQFEVFCKSTRINSKKTVQTSLLTSTRDLSCR